MEKKTKNRPILTKKQTKYKFYDKYIYIYTHKMRIGRYEFVGKIIYYSMNCKLCKYLLLQLGIF